MILTRNIWPNDNNWQEAYLPDKPPTSIFFRFFASMMFTVSFPAVGTYRKEMQMSPSFSCWKENMKNMDGVPSN